MLLRGKSAFTLVELMMVVIVIGILVSLAIPNYVRSIERSRCAVAIQNLKTMRSAALSYYNENETFDDLVNPSDLSAFAGANFVDDDTFWTYAFNPATTIDTFTLRATRNGGPHIGKFITLTQNDVWGGDYPVENPGSL
ncbi:MAG: type IV pilin protein [Candidatus Omnitrophica bacterium]|jgi:prepilin-type N-terminal cleavage/methylation domain|nr:type IV pilin protein [Candidatus Omnitrophota bacterium]